MVAVCDVFAMSFKTLVAQADFKFAQPALMLSISLHLSRNSKY